MKKIDTILNNKENVEKIGKIIAETFINTANKENIEYDFDIKKGTGKIKTKQPNTSFRFDVTENNILYDMKKALFDEDLKNNTQKDEDDMTKNTNIFFNKVYQYIINNYFKEIQDTIRKIVLPGSKPEDIPLNTIEICSIDIIDYSSIPEPAKYLLKIGKMPGQDIDREKLFTYIHQKQEDTGQTVEEIFKEDKDNPVFKHIISLERGKKYIYDITVTFFVNYSLSKMPPKPSTI